jgi:alkylation response protein AidB-like acyl-CoA dehydrogenase
MSYLLNEEGKDLLKMVKDFCENEVKEQCKEYDVSGEFPYEMYKKAMDMQLHLLDIPEEFGGLGLDYITAAALYEEMAYADAGFSVTLAATSLALKPVLIAGTPEQIKLFSDIIIPGRFGAFCLTEATAGSDAGNTKTTAVKDGDEYVINGSKCFITNGGVADVYVVFAMTDKTKGLKGISAFIVPKDVPGISVGKEENKMGIRLSNTSDVFFDNVRVPASYMLGKEGTGFKLAMQTLDLARPFVGACACGIARRALDEAVAYSKERVTFGKPIAANQALQFMMADMDMKIEVARQMCVHSLNLAALNVPYSREAAMAKCFASDVAMEVTIDAIQILGGYGYSRDYPVEKLARDAKIFQIFEGTNQVQRIVIAGQLLR